jgi:hypothetical protein
VATTKPAGGRQIPQNKTRSIRVPEALAFLLLVHSALFAWQYATQTPMVDFFVFWSVPHALSIKPVANIYTEEARHEMGAEMAAEAQAPSTQEVQRQATYANMQDSLHAGRVDSRGSPFLYTLIGLMSSGDYEADQKRFAIISGLCLAAAVAMLCYLLRMSTVSAILLLAFLAADFAPVVSDLGVGNLNEIQLFAVTLFIWFAARSQNLAAGIAIGTVTMIKPTTGIVVALAVIIGLADRDYRGLLRLLIGLGVSTVVCIAVSGLYFGNPKMWIAFIKSLSDTLGDGSYPLEKGNYGLAKLLFGGTGPGTTIILVLLIAVFAWLIFSTRRKAPALSAAMPNAFAAGGVGCAVMLLSSPLAWVHYYVLLIPLSVYVIQAITKEEGAQFSSGILAKALAFLPLLMLSDLAQYLMSGAPRVLAADFNCATVLTLVLALYLIRRQRISAGAIPPPIPSGTEQSKPRRSGVLGMGKTGAFSLGAADSGK